MARDADGHVIVRAVRIAEPIVVDGRLDDPIYEVVPAIDGFVQQLPDEGAPATEPTELWLLFDDDNVYVSARCWNSQPERMVANEMTRDARAIWRNDSLSVLFDTFHDRRNGMAFMTTPLGGLLDIPRHRRAQTSISTGTPSGTPRPASSSTDGWSRWSFRSSR